MMTEQEIQERFPAFDNELAKAISALAVLKTFKEGDYLMKTGQYIRFAVLIIQGRVKLYREGEDGGEFFMYHLEPGDACALSFICAIRNRSSHIVAVATEDTEALLIPIEEMDAMMSRYRSWYHFVLDTYRSRFEELLMVIDNIAFKNMDERLSSYLQREVTEKGPNLYLTHQEIAKDLNSSREVISRLLKKMEKRGQIILHRNHIECIQLDA